MKGLSPLLIAFLIASTMAPAMAQVLADTHDSHHTKVPADTSPQATGNEIAAITELSEGEITRWDPRTLKVTLRHGDIQNLGMPPMTMAFRVKDASLMAVFQPGDKVRFRAEQQSSAYIVTRMENLR